MKILLAALVFSSFALAAPSEKAPKKESQDREKVAKEKLKALNIEDEEDCDEKAKEPVEIIPESISLSGNAGCTLPE